MFMLCDPTTSTTVLWSSAWLCTSTAGAASRVHGRCCTRCARSGRVERSGSGSALRAIQCLPALTGQRRWPAGGIIAGHSLHQLERSRLTRPDLVRNGTREVNMIQLGRVLTDETMDLPEHVTAGLMQDTEGGAR